MKKLLGFLVVMFLFVGVVKAQSFTLEEYIAQAEEDTGFTITNTIENGKITISADGRTLTTNYESNYNHLTYNPDTIGSNDTTILTYLVKAVAEKQGYDFNATTFKGNLSSYTLEKNGVKGAVDSNGKFTSLELYADCFNLDGTNTNCPASGSSTSTTTETRTTTTTTTTKVDNPKTGVFVPIVGLSVLIVASVVCLVWISKKSVFKL